MEALESNIPFSEREVGIALNSLYENQDLKIFNLDQLGTFLSSINTLALIKFKEMSDNILKSVRKIDSEKLARQVISLELEFQFKQTALIVIKQIEHLNFPNFIENLAYHGDIIEKAIGQIQRKIKEGGINLNLQNFAFDYSEFILRTHSESLKRTYRINCPQLYLIRDSSTVINSVSMRYFVISRTTSEPQQASTQHIKVLHRRVVQIKNENSRGSTWCGAKLENNQIFFDSVKYNSLKELIDKEYPNYEPVPAPERRVLDGYVEEYVTVKIKSPSKEDKKPKQVEDQILNHLTDSITLHPYADPVIAPSGISYSTNHLLHQLKICQKDPLTSTELHTHMLKPNHLLSKLVSVRISQHLLASHSPVKSLSEWQMDPILCLFEDPLNHTLMSDPVVANDGETYDRSSITQYLRYSENQLPNNGGPCSEAELVPNIAAKNVLEERKKLFQ